MRPADLERHVGWELKQLPGARAPRTLLPRVMATVNAWALQAWYEQAWFTWPLRWQAASVVGLVLCVVASALSFQGLEAVVQGGLLTLAARLPPAVPDMGDRLEATLLATRILWRALVQPVLVYACAVVALMTVACATVTVALNRAVFGRVHS